MANQLTTPNNLNLGSHFLANLNPCEFHFTLNQYTPTGHNQTAAAVRNLVTFDSAQESQMDVHRADRYWVAYILWTWQFFQNKDYDPDSEIPGANESNGLAYTSNDRRWSGVAIETSRDYFQTGPFSANWSSWGYGDYEDLVWRFAAHEAGHQFGLDHSAPAGLMFYAEGNAAITQHFHPLDLNKLRDRQASPGR